MLARTAALGLRAAAIHSRCACEATLTMIRLRFGVATSGW
jgi:hypothetical protein